MNLTDKKAIVTGAAQGIGKTIALQLAHAGCRSSYRLTGLIPSGPSAYNTDSKRPGKAMSKEEIQFTIESFASAAGRAVQAGFDAIQIHASHGYLLSQFLSPYFNKREDEYGGSIENRARIVIEVTKAIRAAVGSSYPILIKINSEDYLPNGLSSEKMIEATKLFVEAGVDSVEMSGGTGLSELEQQPVRTIDPKTEKDEVYYRSAAIKFREQVAIPLMLVGGIRSFSVAEKLVQDGITDYIAMSRPLISEPDLIKRWHAGETARSTCISCNLCFIPAARGKGVYCVMKEKQKAINS